MAEVMTIPPETLDRRRNPSPERSLLPPPPPLPPPPSRKRERRDDHRSSSPLPPPPPTLGPSRPEREREFRRRHSPPPGPAKRYRRDDGGYDRRRGPEDRRYEYDYGRGYERNSYGSRSRYFDERSHGRYMNHPADDWPDSGYGGYDDGPMARREGLMSYKQFIQELEDDILPAEAERRYSEYRSEYISTQKRDYFEAHKDEEWLKDKYHPTNLVMVIERRNELSRTTAKQFLLDLQNGALDLGPGMTKLSNKPGHGSEPTSEDELDTDSKRRRHGSSPAKENDLSAAPKAHPISSEPRRIEIDIVQAQALVRKLDMEKGIQDNALCGSDKVTSEGEKAHSGSMGPIVIIRGSTSVKGLEGVELLDTIISYLWRVHGLDYYGMSERTEATGLRHVRADNKTNEGSTMSGVDWITKLDSFWQDRLQGQDRLEIMTAKEKIEAAAVEVLDPHVRRIKDEKYGWKYGCGAKGCTKLFHAPEFVHKHLRLKHPDLVIQLTSKVRDDLYFQNYMNDADAPGGTPVMQISATKSKARYRQVSGYHRRDDRDNHRENDRTDRVIGQEKHGRTENFLSHDKRSNNGGPEGGHSDDLMYDAYPKPELHGGPPFPSDIPPPPPVLMPVPGAGPLGPFVPAPPEVAMRMLREQGGPSSYEGNVGARSRKGRSSPLLAGPTPILPMSSTFQHDPRRIRSYQDLDAPGEEVTVIDYRSL